LLTTHDIALSVGSITFRIIILTESSVSTSFKPATLARVQHFQNLTGGMNSFIFFVPSMPTADRTLSCQNALQGFQDFQFFLLSNSIIIPVLYVSSPEALPSALKCLTTATPHSAEPVVPHPVTAILPYCTVEPPMSQETLTILSDLYPNMRSLASLQSEEITTRMVVAGMSETDAENCLAFWKEELLAE
jgi:hypothetical protein